MVESGAAAGPAGVDGSALTPRIVETLVKLGLAGPAHPDASGIFAFLQANSPSRGTIEMAQALQTLLMADEENLDAAIADALIAHLPADDQIRFAVARIALEKGLEEGVTDRLISSIDVSRTLNRAKLRDCAREYQANGHTARAVPMLKALLDTKPAEIWDVVRLLQILHEAGRGDEARDIALREGLPEARGQALIALGHAHMQIGLGASARRLFLAVDSTLTSDAVAVNHSLILARGLCFAGEYDAAARWYASVEPKSPDGFDPLRPAIIDPGYTDAAGHHTNYCLFASDILEDLLGRTPIVYVGSRAPAEKIERLAVRRAFRFEPYVFNQFEIGDSEARHLNHFFERDLERVFGRQRPPVIFVHSMRLIMLAGFVDWLGKTAVGAKTLVIVGLIEADHLQKGDQAKAGLLSDVSDWLETRDDITLTLYAETDAAVEWLDASTPHSIVVDKFPYLAAGRARQSARGESPPSERPLTFGILGATREERGLGATLRAAWASANLPAQWRIQINADAAARFEDDSAVYLEKIQQEPGDRVTLIDGFLEVEEYYSELSKIDCMVLPYYGRYSVSGSGVVYEAIYAGRYIIVSEGSTLAHDLAALDYPHKTVLPNDPDALLAAVRYVVENWPQIQEQLATFARSKVKLPVERFMERMDDLLADKPAAPPGPSLLECRVETLERMVDTLVRERQALRSDELTTRTIVFDESFANSAFYYPEKHPQSGVDFRWFGKTDEATIGVAVPQGQALRIDVHIAAFVSQDALQAFEFGCDGVFPDEYEIDCDEHGLTRKSAIVDCGAVGSAHKSQLVLRAGVKNDMSAMGDPRTLVVGLHKIMVRQL